jgi:dipeptide/tripeptide permease
MLFLALTLGVRLVFTHQFLVMPKYYTRVVYNDFSIGYVNMLNPAIIVIGLILVIPIINKFDTLRLIIVGMFISALSLLPMAMPLDWMLSLPMIENYNQALWFIIILQIVVFAIGELIFSPRFMEYIASVAPKDKVGSYMGLSALPMFIAKPVNGLISGILIAKFCYPGIRAKIETGDVKFFDSPSFMWLIYFLIAATSPIAVLMLKKFLTSSNNNDDDTPEEAAKDELQEQN